MSERAERRDTREGGDFGCIVNLGERRGRGDLDKDQPGESELSVSDFGEGEGCLVDGADAVWSHEQYVHSEKFGEGRTRQAGGVRGEEASGGFDQQRISSRTEVPSVGAQSLCRNGRSGQPRGDGGSDRVCKAKGRDVVGTQTGQVGGRAQPSCVLRVRSAACFDGLVGDETKMFARCDAQ